MATKLLKYGIGIFAPEAPAGFKRSCLKEAAPRYHRVHAGTDGGLIVLDPAGGTETTFRIFLERGSRARFMEKAEGGGCGLRVELALEDGAEADYLAMPEAANAFISRGATIGREARLRWHEAYLGTGFVRAATATILGGDGAEVVSRALVLGSGAALADLRHDAFHVAPRTVSDLKTRAVLSGTAKAVVRGLVRVEREAFGCSGREDASALLLAPKAEMDAVPTLEILNDDVRCGHAAAVGRPDEEKLFYLMSRGLDRAAAVQALVDGFVAPFVDALPEAFREEVAAAVAARA